MCAESDPTYMGGGKRSRGTLLGIFNFLKRKRDDMLPQFTSKIPSSYLSSKERVLWHIVCGFSWTSLFSFKPSKVNWQPCTEVDLRLCIHDGSFSMSKLLFHSRWGCLVYVINAFVRWILSLCDISGSSRLLRLWVHRCQWKPCRHARMCLRTICIMQPGCMISLQAFVLNCS